MNLAARLRLLRDNMNRLKLRNDLMRFLPFIIIGVFLLAGLYILGDSLTKGSNDIRAEAPVAKARQGLNKQLEFPIRDQEGKEVSKVRYVIESAELHDTIIVKGQRAVSVKGRTFLVLPLKITNNYSKPIEIKARDYVRVQIGNSDQRLAADVHNDPVQVQPMSTKITRIGFPINDSDKDKLTLYIGELNGNKEKIKLNLK